MPKLRPLEQAQWISRGKEGTYSKQMGIVYHVGGDANKEHFSLLGTWPERYGERYIVPLGYFKERVYDAEVTNGLDVNFLLSGVEAAHHAYYDGWEIWIRAIVEKTA